METIALQLSRVSVCRRSKRSVGAKFSRVSFVSTASHRFHVYSKLHGWGDVGNTLRVKFQCNSSAAHKSPSSERPIRSPAQKIHCSILCARDTSLSKDNAGLTIAPRLGKDVALCIFSTLAKNHIICNLCVGCVHGGNMGSSFGIKLFCFALALAVVGSVVLVFLHS